MCPFYQISKALESNKFVSKYIFCKGDKFKNVFQLVYFEKEMFLPRPTEHFTILEPRNPSIDVSELHKISDWQILSLPRLSRQNNSQFWFPKTRRTTFFKYTLYLRILRV